MDFDTASLAPRKIGDRNFDTRLARPKQALDDRIDGQRIDNRLIALHVHEMSALWVCATSASRSVPVACGDDVITNSTPC